MYFGQISWTVLRRQPEVSELSEQRRRQDAVQTSTVYMQESDICNCHQSTTWLELDVVVNSAPWILQTTDQILATRAEDHICLFRDRFPIPVVVKLTDRDKLEQVRLFNHSCPSFMARALPLSITSTPQNLDCIRLCFPGVFLAHHNSAANRHSSNNPLKGRPLLLDRDKEHTGTRSQGASFCSRDRLRCSVLASSLADEVPLGCLECSPR